MLKQVRGYLELKYDCWWFADFVYLIGDCIYYYYYYDLLFSRMFFQCVEIEIQQYNFHHDKVYQ